MQDFFFGYSFPFAFVIFSDYLRLSFFDVIFSKCIIDRFVTNNIVNYEPIDQISPKAHYYHNNNWNNEETNHVFYSFSKYFIVFFLSLVRCNGFMRFDRVFKEQKACLFHIRRMNYYEYNFCLSCLLDYIADFRNLLTCLKLKNKKQ